MKKHIAILATGGTIAGSGEPGKNTGYVSGAISAEDLISSVPQLKEVADISVEQICNVNSDDITDAIWLELAKRINALQSDSSVDGIVITHGTDTMDETAYFLSLTTFKNKPVILTGSMRPATAKEPDGPANLLGAVKTVVALSSQKNFADSPFVYFGGKIFAAKDVQKCSASELQPMGIQFPGDGALIEIKTCENCESAAPQFDVSTLISLPKVNVVYFAADSDPRILTYAAEISDGIVIAGAGSGEFSIPFAKALSKIQKSVVISTRIHHGTVTLNESLAPGRICAKDLPPQKAAILLKLMLANS